MGSSTGETPTAAEAARPGAGRSADAVVRRARGLLLTAQGPVALHTALGYSRHDPLAVTLTLRFPGGGPERRWVFARDLLDEGLRTAAGLSDVQVRTVDHDQLLIEMSRRSGYAALVLRSADVRAFLHHCDLAVPAGRESLRPCLDAFLSLLLP
ncbi:SsgA family sporulation/cell division regulator [Streptomyces griseosporeus]|uniref:SsgA family sporulation/cell division regulator n=1 Tax=Streptomyces griseosporeus TaxID=1910 RepID=UPI0036FB6EF4